MVHAAEADVVGPAVAAEDPQRLLGEILLVLEDFRHQLARVAVAELRAAVLELLGVGLELGKLVAKDLGRVGAAGEGHDGVHGHDALFQELYILRGGFRVGLAVFHGVQPLLGGVLQALIGVRHRDQLLGQVRQTVADGLLAQIHAQAVLGVVLEQGVGPGGAVAVLVGAIRRGGRGTAPDGGAAGGVGDIHPVTEELGDETGIAGLGAAGAGAGELEEGLVELAAGDRVVLEILLLGDLGHAVVEDLLLLGLLLLGHHLQGLLALAARADAHAHAAAHAVQGRHGDGKLVALALSGFVDDLGGGGELGGFLLRHGEGTDGGMGADIGALVALDAVLGHPGGNGDGHAALFIGGGAQLELAVGVLDEGGDGEAVAVHLAHGVQDGLDLLHQLRLAGQGGGVGGILGVGPVGGNLELLIGRGSGVDGLVVHIHHVLSLFQVGVGGGVLHILDGLGLGHDLRQGEEGGLEDGVGPLAHADFLSQVDGVDGVDLDIIFGDIPFRHGGHVLVDFLVAPLAVDQEGAAGLHVTDHGEGLDDIGGHVAGHEVGLVDIIRSTDGLVTEAQMADGDAAGLLGVILEVGLDVFVRVVADDFDGVFVGAHGSVAAETPELALDGALRRGVGGGLLLEAEVGHVVHDADGELALGLGLGQLLIDGEDAAGRGVLAAQAVAAADDGDIRPSGVGQGRHHVHIQGLTQGAGLLGAVQHGNLLAGSGDGGDQLVGAPGAVQADLDEADLFAVGVHIVDDFLGHVADGAHGNNDTVCVGSAVVVEELIVGAQLFVDLAHILFHDVRQRVVVGVAGLAVLEEDIAVLVRAPHVGPLGVQCVLAERVHRVHVAHFLQVVVIPHGHLLDLVGGAEAVEEVHEGNAALNGGQMGHGTQVHDLLDVALAQQGEAGLAAGHDVGVVAEDVQRVAGHGTGGHVEHAGQQLAGDLVHVGDHQQQTLRGGVGGGHRAGGQGAVDGAGGAGLGLHLADLHGGAENVFLTGGCPLVDQVCHGRRRGDGVNARHLGKRVADICRRVVSVHGLELSCHKLTSCKFAARGRQSLQDRGPKHSLAGPHAVPL